MAFNPWTQAEVITQVAALEKLSEHPLAAAIVKKAEAYDSAWPKVEEFEAVPGFGVKALVDGKRVLVGSARFLEQAHVPIFYAQPTLQRLTQTGRSVIFLAVDDNLAGVIGVADTIKPQAGETIRSLEEMGLRVWMLSGDNARTAHVVAEQLQIKEVMAEVMPADKAAKVADLQRQGRTVAMVGDGYQ